MRKFEWISFLAVVAACDLPKGEPALEVKLSPSRVSDDTPVRVQIAGTKADGTIADGSVRITSTHGTLVTPVELQFDNYGTARLDFICDPVAEPACAQPVRVLAEWTTNGVEVTGEARLNATGGSGSGGGTGGTTGGGGGGGGAGGGGGGGGTGFGLSNAFAIGNVIGGAPGVRAFTPMNAPMTILGLIPSGNGATITRSREIFYSSWNGQVHGNIYRVVADQPDTTDPGANDIQVPNDCGAAGADFYGVWPDTDALAVGCIDPSVRDPKLKVDADQQIVALGWNSFILALHKIDYTYSIWRDGSKIADLLAPQSTAATTADATGFLMSEGPSCSVSKFSYATGAKVSLGVFSGELPGWGRCCDYSAGGKLARDGSLLLGTRFAQSHGFVRCELNGGASVVLDSSQASPLIDASSWAYASLP